MRTIYLQQYLSINGRNALAGRVLFDRLKELSEETLLGHVIYEDEMFSKVTNSAVRQDIISHTLLRQLRPDLVYVEGGLFADEEGLWRIPRAIAEEICAAGGVIIVADVEHNRLYRHKEHYRAAGSFFKAYARYGEDDSPHPVYASDQVSCWKGDRQIVCRPEKMVLDEWLRPIYKGIPGILAGLPIPLRSWESILASCNTDSTNTLHLDNWVDMGDPCPFASVAQRGSGFAVLIAGAVSSDVWLEGCPHNTLWLSRTAEFLLDQAKRDRSRRVSPRLSPHLLFLSHRSTDKALVREVALAVKRKGLGIWFDEEQLVPSQSLVEEIGHALERMTHYVLFWSQRCQGAPWVDRELRAAVSRLIEKQVPLLIVRLDGTPVPAILADVFRIDAAGRPPDEIALRIAGAVERLARPG